MTARPPCPPFDRDSALKKVRAAEDAWNSCDPATVVKAYSADCRWRNRSEFFHGHDAIVDFLTRKWQKELGYRLAKELWAFDGHKIAVRFQYEWHDRTDQWYRAYGNEQWEFNDQGLMIRREASINEIPIEDDARRFRWQAPGPRPADHPGLNQLGL